MSWICIDEVYTLDATFFLSSSDSKVDDGSCRGTLFSYGNCIMGNLHGFLWLDEYYSSGMGNGLGCKKSPWSSQLKRRFKKGSPAKAKFTCLLCHMRMRMHAPVRAVHGKKNQKSRLHLID